MNALEEAGLELEDRAINIFSGEQKENTYLAINPKGKVPALRIGETAYTENAAIIHMLAMRNPAGNLILDLADRAELNIGLLNLVCFSSILHLMFGRLECRVVYGWSDRGYTSARH